MQEMVIQGKRLNYSQTKVSNALAVTEVHVGHVRYTFLKVNRCPNKSFGKKLWYSFITRSSRCLQSYIALVDNVACIAKFTNFAILRSAA